MAEPTRKPRRRWPGRPKPSIPASARERVRRHASGGSSTEFWIRRRLVGRAFRDEEGRLVHAYGIRRGVPHGPMIGYDSRGRGLPSSVTPFVNGLVHGWTREYFRDRRLLIEWPFVRGTGVDYWWLEDGRLCAEFPFVSGKPSGVERWWVDAKTIFQETHLLDGLWHGPRRRWTAAKLDPGHPKLFIRGKQVSRRAYLAAQRRDPSLPPLRAEDDDPRRALRAQFVRRKRWPLSKQARSRTAATSRRR